MHPFFFGGGGGGGATRTQKLGAAAYLRINIGDTAIFYNMVICLLSRFTQMKTSMYVPSAQELSVAKRSL
jgi:hypothetical protein